jgi:hypothetical protein
MLVPFQTRFRLRTRKESKREIPMHAVTVEFTVIFDPHTATPDTVIYLNISEKLHL